MPITRITIAILKKTQKKQKKKSHQDAGKQYRFTCSWMIRLVIVSKSLLGKPMVFLKGGNHTALSCNPESNPDSRMIFFTDSRCHFRGNIPSRIFVSTICCRLHLIIANYEVIRLLDEK